MKKKIDLASSLTKQKEQDETPLLEPESSSQPTAKTSRKSRAKSPKQKEKEHYESLDQANR